MCGQRSGLYIWLFVINNDTTLSRPDKSAAICETGPQLWGMIFPIVGLSVNDSALSE